MSYLIVISLVILSGIFSGLTLGLFSLGKTSLERKIKLGDKRAVKIYSIRKNSSLLLCTLLLGNVAVNSSMAIFLGNIATGFIAGIVSTGLIVVFGEILPQAMFARHAMSVGYRTVWLVKVFIVLLYPIAKPLAIMLDKILGEENPVIWSKDEISEIIRHHEDSPDSPIDSDEERIILGALTFSEKEAHDIMTPKTVVYYLNIITPITQSLLNEIKEKGYSRIPVFENNPDNMTGILFTKDLLGLDLSKDFIIKHLVRKDKFINVDWSIKLDNLMDKLIKSKVHMAYVYDEFGAFNGIVTLEDIIEEIIKVEIMDEADKIDNLQKFARERFKNRLA
jgi:metal transporter CNNM